MIHYEIPFNLSQCLPLSFLGSSVVNWVSDGYLKYKHKSVILIEFKDKLLPVFGKIELILKSTSGEIGFLYKIIYSTCFDEHVFAYEVGESTDEHYFVNYKDLLEHPTASLHRQADGKMFLTYKNIV